MAFILKERAFISSLACLHWHIYLDGEHWGLGPVQGGCVPASCPVTTGIDSVFNRNKMEYGRMVDDLWRKRPFNVLIQSPLEMGQLDLFIQEAPSADWWGSLVSTYGAGLNSEPSRDCPSYRREPICLSCPLLFPDPRTHLCNLCLI